MQRFLDHHDENILGVLTGFDRIVFRGTLRNLSYVDGMGQFLGHHGIRYTEFGDFAEGITDRLRSHARQYAKQHGRPYRHLDSPKISKEEQAVAIRDADGIEEGLVCVFGCVEQSMTYEYTPRKDRSGPWLRRRVRQCLFVYFYYPIHPPQIKQDLPFGRRGSPWSPTRAEDMKLQCVLVAGLDYGLNFLRASRHNPRLGPVEELASVSYVGYQLSHPLISI